MSDTDRAGLSTVGRIPVGQPASPPASSAAHDELLDQLGRRLLRWVFDKLRPWLLHLGMFGGGVAVNHYASDAPASTEQREHAASGPSPEQPIPQPVNVELVDELARCQADTRLAIDTCVEQAKACGAEDVPRPANIPTPYEKTP